jgi:hypothetical protein
MYALPTLYKARNLPSLKRPVCAICIDRTQGRANPTTTHTCHTCTAHTPSRRTLRRLFVVA